MKKIWILMAVAIVAAGCKTEGTVQTPTPRYSQEVIDACLYHFRANTRPAGFARYDSVGNILSESESTRGFDYVPGLVAKAVLEAVDYYQQETFVRPWLYSMMAYADAYYGLDHDGKSLDDLNACKMYFTLADLTAEGAVFADPERHAHYRQAMAAAGKGLMAHHREYCIAEGEYKGGWWHKNTYPNQMWCDGQYMGPALLAQLLAAGMVPEGYTREECWKIAVQQLDLTMGKLWVEETGLLKHAFSATPDEQAVANTDVWADPETGVSAEYWGRAEGWYMLALVDVLEAMATDGKQGDTDYVRLQGYLDKVAAGLAAKQTANGCWYQLLNHDGDFISTQYSGMEKPAVQNYEESSCTAIFAAAYLKAVRLGLLDKARYESIGQRAYEGCVAQFMRREDVGDGNVLALVDCCASAGLGGGGQAGRPGGEKCRDGSADYYLQGYDVRRVTDYTEGKVLGAFVLAAVEYERTLSVPLEGGR